MNKPKTIGIFGLGVVVGAILVGGLIALRQGKAFKEQYYSDISELVNTAYMIRDGRENQLAHNTEANIQQCVVAADSLWGDTEARLSALWYLQRYYQQFNIDIPNDVNTILTRLPPEPPCKRKSIVKEDSNSI
jgi:hypothetical protein